MRPGWFSKKLYAIGSYVSGALYAGAVLLCLAICLLVAGESQAWVVQGTVYGGGNPLPQARVMAGRAEDSSPAGSATTDADGRYAIEVPDGFFNLQIEPPADSGFMNSAVNGVPVSGADVTQNVVLLQPSVMISGTVVNPAGVGMRNILLIIREQVSGVEAGRVWTDADGRYSLAVAAGTYRIDLRGGGSAYADYCGAGNSWSTDCSTNVPAPQYFFGDRIVSNMTISVPTVRDITLPIVTLSGRIIDRYGGALGGVRIEQPDRKVALSTGGSYTVCNDWGAGMASDASGSYRLHLISGTGYSLTLTPPADAANLSQTRIHDMAVTADTGRDLVVEPSIVLSGTVRNPAGAGVRNIQLMIRDQASLSMVALGWTDADGRYSIPLSAGRYRIDLQGGSAPYEQACGPGGVWSSDCSTDVPFPQKFVGAAVVSYLAVTASTVRDITIPFVALSGRTIDRSGVPVGGVTIRHPYKYVPVPSGGYYYFYNDLTPGIRSDAEGRYRIGLISGTGHSLTLLPPAGMPLVQTVVNGIVATADTIRDLTVEPIITLSGTVRNPAGVAVGNIEVRVLDQASGVEAGRVWTDAAGNYSMPLSSGTYKIHVKGYGAPAADFCGSQGAWSSNCAINVPAPKSFVGEAVVSNLVVNAPTVRDLTLPLVTLNGRTIDRNGTPVAGVKILQPYMKLAGVTGGTYTLYNDWMPAIQSDASGRFSLTVLSGTGYSITLVPPAGTDLIQTVVSDLALTVDTARDFVVQPVLTLSGTVRNPSGGGMRNVRVQVLNQESGVEAASAWTDAGGRYSVRLGSGTYRLNVRGGRMEYPDRCGQANAYSLDCSTHTDAPQYFFGDSVMTRLVLTDSTTRDIVVPFATISGRTTDSNGVPVGGVVVKHPPRSLTVPSGATYWIYNDWLPFITSDASGYYRMTVVPADGYPEIIVPPEGSGFVQTVINDLSVSSNMLQNIILSYPDIVPPLVLAGPTVSAVTDTSAVVQWQTSEPTTGRARYGLNVSPASAEASLEERTIHAVPLTGLIPDTLYYVRAEATDRHGNGPVSSGIVSFRTRPVPDRTPPVFIEGPVIRTCAVDRMVVEWQTNEPTRGVVLFGATLAETSLSSHHRVKLENLSPSTSYSLQVRATDAAGNGPTTSAMVSCTTPAAPDTTPPVILEGPMAVDITSNGAMIVWKTDEPATSGVSWNDGTAYGLVTDEGGSLEHGVRMTGLLPLTTYTVTVSTKDVSGNGPTLSRPFTFTTPAAPDTRPPVIIEGPIIKNITHQSAVIWWRTDEPADSVIEYGTTPALGQVDSRAALTQPHNLTLTGLSPGTLYYFRILSRDGSGNGPAASDTHTFTTDPDPVGGHPAITVQPRMIYTSDTSATVYWETGTPADSVVEYGPAGTLNHRLSDSARTTRHQVTLTHLKAAQDYSVRVSSTDLYGNTVSADVGPAASSLAAGQASAGERSLAAGAVPAEGFRTAIRPDTMAPTIVEGPMVTGLDSTKAVIYWKTDEIADSRVDYGLGGQAFTGVAGGIAWQTDHAVVLTNLSPGAVYDVQVSSSDPSGNGPVRSGVFRLTTPAAPDLTAPVISAVEIVPREHDAVIAWSTDEAATSEIRYGRTPETMTGAAAAEGLGRSHSITLSGLEAGTAYYVRILSRDVSHNEAGHPAFFTTAGRPPHYVVTPSVTGSGTIDPSTPQPLTGRDAVTFTLTAAEGYRLDSIGGCPGVLVGNQYRVANVTADCTVSASFLPDPPAGVCGEAHGRRLAASPGIGLCSLGLPSAVTGAGPWHWTCSGGHEGSEVFCSALPLTETIVAALDSGAAYTHTATVSLNISTTAPESVSAVCVSNTGTCANWSEVTWPISRLWPLAAGADGERTVNLWFKDAFGRTTPEPLVRTITLDTRSPAGSMAINNGAARTNRLDVTLTLAPVANGSPVTHYQASNTSTFSSVWEVYSPIQPVVSWTLSGGEGTKTVSLRYKDAAGNVSAAIRDTIVLDTLPPALTIGAVTPSLTHAKTVGGTKEAGSTVTVETPIGVTARFSPTTTAASTTWSCTLDNLKSGDNRVVFTATDPAGNRTSRQISVVSLAGAPSGWYASGLAGESIGALTMSPADPETLYAGTYGGVVYKTVDAGESWQPIFDAEFAVHAIAINPVDPDHLFVATSPEGSADIGSDAGGVYRSTDGGATWSLVLPDVFAYSVKVDPVTPAKILVGTAEEGIWRSTDGGDTWARQSGGFPVTEYGVLNEIQDIQFDRTPPAVVYCAAQYGGVFKSVNGGVSWSATGLRSGPVQSLAIAPSNKSILYAGGFEPGSVTPVASAQFFKSVDAGRTWKRLLATGGGVNDNLVIQGITVSPTNPNEVFMAVSGWGMMKSANGGTSWKAINTGLQTDGMSEGRLVMHPATSRIIYLATYSGVYKTMNGGE